jgi:hypothetical protein
MESGSLPLPSAHSPLAATVGVVGVSGVERPGLKGVASRLSSRTRVSRNTGFVQVIRSRPRVTFSPSSAKVTFSAFVALTKEINRGLLAQLQRHRRGLRLCGHR